MGHGKSFERRVSLNRVIAARIGRLSPGCRRLLALASVLGREVDAGALGRLAGASDVRRFVEEARSAGVVVDVPGEPRRLRFAHALLRDVCYASLSPAVRARLHRRAAGVLGAMPDPGSHATEIAHHLAAGARDEDRLAAAERLLAASDRALRSLAFEEAARLCRRGLDVLGDRRPRDPAEEALRERLQRALVAADGTGAGAGIETPSPS